MITEQGASAETKSPLQWALDGKVAPEFWHETELLAHILDCAHRRIVSPEMVLHSLLVRVAAFVPHTVNVESGIGPSSLNMYSIAVGPSGSGKTTGWKAARDLLPEEPWQIPDFTGERPIGTGEGLAELFMGTVQQETGRMTTPKRGRPAEPETIPVRKQVRHNALIYVDEGATLDALMGRPGAVLGAVLREAWSCGGLGQTNATGERTRLVAAGSYSLGVMVGYQPARLGALFSDAEVRAGTPQRFLFAPAIDPTMPDLDESDYGGRIDPLPGMSTVAAALRGQAGGLFDMHVPAAVKRMIQKNATLKHRGEIEVHELDAHMFLARCRVAALLALLHGELTISDLMWDLAGQLIDASTRLRTAVMQMVKDSADEDRAKRNTANIADELERRESLRRADEERESKDVELVLSHIVRLAQESDGPVRVKGTNGAKQLVLSRRRKYFDDALAMAEHLGHVVVMEQDGETYYRARGSRPIQVVNQ